MKRLAHKLQEQEGASFSVALLLLLVCAVASSILLAASTASVGQFAGQAKMDQNYYSVTSAAKLFTASLDGGMPSGMSSSADDGTRSFSFVQKKVGTRTVTRPKNGNPVYSDEELVDGQTEATFLAPASASGYDFLCDLTCYALSGKGRAAAGDSVLTDMLEDEGWSSWVEPFETGAWASVVEDVSSGLKVSPDIGYELAPTLVGSSASAESVAVEVKARLHSDWTLELEFCNKTSEPNERFSLYVLLSADVDSSDSESEEVTGTSVDASTGATVTEESIEKARTTTVTWGIDQIVAGRGLSDVA